MSQVPSVINRSDESNVALGVALPQYGTIASPKTILLVVEVAEKMGLASLWVSDHVSIDTQLLLLRRLVRLIRNN